MYFYVARVESCGNANWYDTCVLIIREKAEKVAIANYKFEVHYFGVSFSRQYGTPIASLADKTLKGPITNQATIQNNI